MYVHRFLYELNNLKMDREVFRPNWVWVPVFESFPSLVCPTASVHVAVVDVGRIPLAHSRLEFRKVFILDWIVVAREIRTRMELHMYWYTGAGFPPPHSRMD